MPLSWVIIFPWEKKFQVNLQVTEMEIAADFAKPQVADIDLVWKGRWKVTWKLLLKSWKKNSFLEGRVGERDKSWEDSFVAYWIKDLLVSATAFFFASGREALESSSKEMECVKENRKRESVHWQVDGNGFVMVFCPFLIFARKVG